MWVRVDSDQRISTKFILQISKHLPDPGHMSDPAGSGRRSSGRASNFFPHLLSEILSNMSGRSESSDIGSDPYDIGSDSYDIGSDPYDSDTLSWSAPVSDNREDDFDLFVDGNVSEGYYVALFLQQILSRWVRDWFVCEHYWGSNWLPILSLIFFGPICSFKFSYVAYTQWPSPYD